MEREGGVDDSSDFRDPEVSGDKERAGEGGLLGESIEPAWMSMDSEGERTTDDASEGKGCST